jgi:hypothetical protein
VLGDLLDRLAGPDRISAPADTAADAMVTANAPNVQNFLATFFVAWGFKAER